MKYSQEIYDIGSEESSQANIWLPEQILPGFRTCAMKLFTEMNKLSMAVLECLLIGSGFDRQEADAIKKMHSGRDNHIRLSHYPSVSAKHLKPEELDRMHSHRDWG